MDSQHIARGLWPALALALLLAALAVLSYVALDVATRDDLHGELDATRAATPAFESELDEARRALVGIDTAAGCPDHPVHPLLGPASVWAPTGFVCGPPATADDDWLADAIAEFLADVPESDGYLDGSGRDDLFLVVRSGGDPARVVSAPLDLAMAATELSADGGRAAVSLEGALVVPSDPDAAGLEPGVERITFEEVDGTSWHIIQQRLANSGWLVTTTAPHRAGWPLWPALLLAVAVVAAVMGAAFWRRRSVRPSALDPNFLSLLEAMPPVLAARFDREGKVVWASDGWCLAHGGRNRSQIEGHVLAEVDPDFERVVGPRLTAAITRRHAWLGKAYVPGRGTQLVNITPLSAAGRADVAMFDWPAEARSQRPSDLERGGRALLLERGMSASLTDLRTSASAIAGLLALGRGSGSDDGMRRMVGRIESMVDELASLFEGWEQDVVEEGFDGQWLRWLGPDHELEFHLGADLASSTLAPARMRHLLGELVSNAADSSRVGSTIEVSSSASSTSLRLDVADRGRGIGPKLWCALADGDDDLSPAIGLVGISRMIESVGGGIEFLQRDGGGLIARVQLPLAAVEPD